MKKHYLLYLQQFAEGGTDGDSGGTASSQAAAETSGEGTGQDAADEQQQETQKATFDELIKGEYKEDYDKAVQRIINRRFSKAKANEDKLNQIAPIMDALASKYGVNSDDIASIARYVSEDDQMFEEAAYKAGMTVDQFKNYSRVMAENERLRAEHEANEQRRAQNEWFQQKVAEAEQLKAEFPEFDLDQMMQDERFVNLIHPKNPYAVPIRQAYLAMNMDNILPGAMAQTARTVAKKTADTIRQRGNRPVEGGMSGQAASKVGSDVSKLTNAEIAEMHERILRGELIHP